MDWKGGNPLIWGLMNGWSRREQYTSIANLILEGGEGEEENLVEVVIQYLKSGSQIIRQA